MEYLIFLSEIDLDGDLHSHIYQLEADSETIDTVAETFSKIKYPYAVKRTWMTLPINKNVLEFNSGDN